MYAGEQSCTFFNKGSFGLLKTTKDYQLCQNHSNNYLLFVLNNVSWEVCLSWGLSTMPQMSHLSRRTLNRINSKARSEAQLELAAQNTTKEMSQALQGHTISKKKKISPMKSALHYICPTLTLLSTFSLFHRSHNIRRSAVRNCRSRLSAIVCHRNISLINLPLNKVRTCGIHLVCVKEEKRSKVGERKHLQLRAQSIQYPLIRKMVSGLLLPQRR